MGPTRGDVRYHAPRDRSPVPALVVGALVVVTLVSAQLWVAGEPSRSAPTTAAAAQEVRPDPAASDPTVPDPSFPDPGPSGSTVPAPAASDPASSDPAPSTSRDDATADADPEPDGVADADADADADTDADTDTDADAAVGLVEVTFDVGAEAPSGDAGALLAPVVDALLADPSARVRIVGHAAPSNDPVLEEQLSLRRAESVLDVLVGEGVAAGRAEVVAAGAEEAGRSRSGTDRRVTVEVLAG